MARIRRENQPSPACGHAHHLQPLGVTADEMQRDAGKQLRVAVVKSHPSAIDVAYHSDNVLDVERPAENRV